MKAAHVMVTAILAFLAGVAGTVLVTQPSEARDMQPKTVSPPAARAAPQGAAVASLGDVSLYQGEVTAWLTTLPDGARSALRDKRAMFDDWARRRLAEKALVAEARQQGWEKRDEVSRALARAEDQVLLRSYLSAVSEAPEGYPDEALLKQVYENGKDNMRVPERYHLRQIFLAATGEDTESIETRARQLTQQARAKGTDFAALARRHSDEATSAAQGGAMGPLPLAQLTPEVRPVVAGLEPGQVSDPVRTAAGWHLIKLEQVDPERTATFEEVRGQLTATLREQRRRQNAESHLRRLVGESSLSIDGAAITAILEEQQ